MYTSASQSLGEAIRQMRRQQSLTQTDLGGKRFSKSYVSAVERDKITPSYEALYFFAEQLGQEKDYFASIFHQNEQAKHIAAMEPHPYPVLDSENSQAVRIHTDNDATIHDNFLFLLDAVLEHAELHPDVSRQLAFSDDITQMITTLPSQFQGRFAFLLGLQEMQQGNHSLSLSAFEHALTLAPTQYHPAILDALGMNYYTQKDYHVALNYHLRAANLLDEKASDPKLNGNAIENSSLHDSSKESENTSPTALRLKVYLHCGNAYRALGAQKQAKNYYERAYHFLSASTNIQTVGELLQSLGYSTYAYTYQQLYAARSPSISAEEAENGFQRAISFLVQSRTIYQIGGDLARESQSRLTQATVLLDTSTWKRQLAQKQLRQTGKPLHVTHTALLDEAEEQCRQILIKWSPSLAPHSFHSPHPASTSIPSIEAETYLYGAMARMVHIFMQRAITAEAGGYTDTARRERALAAHYCQQLLDSLSEEVFPQSLVYDLATLQRTHVHYQSLSLPRLPRTASSRHPLSQSVTYFATAAIAEMLGQSATHTDYIYEAYQISDESIRLTLDNAQAAYTEKLVDVSYVVRCYQRCVSLLEEREEIAAERDIQIDGILRTILKDGLQKLATPPL